MLPAPPVALLSVSLESWLTIAAILVGPLAALLIQKKLEDRGARVDRKVRIFRDLMANRASRLSAPYVQALNGIETEFYGDRKVIEAWRSLVNHLNTPQGAGEPALARWTERLTELLNNMLYEMGESLGYHFDKVTLERNAYYPTHWNTIEAENTQLRQAAIKVFEGQMPLKVKTGEDPVRNSIVPR
jgi:hypothetical protein